MKELRSNQLQNCERISASWYIPVVSRRFCSARKNGLFVSSKISLTYSFKQLKPFPTPELIDNLPVNCFQGLSENVKSLFLCVSKPHTGEGGRLPYRESTRTWAFGRRLCSQNVFCKQKILKQRTNKIHRFQGCLRRGQVSSKRF